MSDLHDAVLNNRCCSVKKAGIAPDDPFVADTVYNGCTQCHILKNNGLASLNRSRCLVQEIRRAGSVGVPMFQAVLSAPRPTKVRSFPWCVRCCQHCKGVVALAEPGWCLRSLLLPQPHPNPHRTRLLRAIVTACAVGSAANAVMGSIPNSMITHNKAAKIRFPHLFSSCFVAAAPWGGLRQFGGQRTSSCPSSIS